MNILIKKTDGLFLNEETVRIISARKATKNEEKNYKKRGRI